ncbi:hypothetical protein M404DRAFT_711554 [Pisolithus tinctorius Marx 270]|uniref:Uncharacterized protein n=1 Tax=Pisolithus tinctorius Marx 270 TaxID=870435 RepID=A0A0C3KU43_PISTI|nr:hypothetical protein M404DRAFT_711554 [Pisolithus tinctorius Marx 270]
MVRNRRQLKSTRAWEAGTAFFKTGRFASIGAALLSYSKYSLWSGTVRAGINGAQIARGTTLSSQLRSRRPFKPHGSVNLRGYYICNICISNTSTPRLGWS